MISSPQDGVVIILVRARNPSNIGAVARAMHDFGFQHLRVVNDFPMPFEAALLAEKAAVHSGHVLRSAVSALTVAEAVADCTLVLGTTAVGARVLEHPLETIREAAVSVRTHLNGQANARVALLFGSEKTGLSNDELSHCHALVTIPMNPHSESGHLSMNLGQAAAVCLYELAHGASIPTRHVAEESATAGDLERLTTLLTDVMARTGYTRRYPANAREAVVRRLVRRIAHRLALTPAEAQTWTGLLRQILRALPVEHATAPAADKEFPTGV